MSRLRLLSLSLSFAYSLACGSEDPNIDGSEGSSSTEATSEAEGDTGDSDSEATDTTTSSTTGSDTGNDGALPAVITVRASHPTMGRVFLNGQECTPECSEAVMVGTTMSVDALPAGPFLEFDAWTTDGATNPCRGAAGTSCDFEANGTTTLVGAFTATRNLAFRTYDGYAPADLAGLEGADQRCAQEAATHGIPGDTWVAWLSTSTVDARDRLQGARGWIRLDGLPIVDEVGDLVAGQMLHPVTYDAEGGTIWAEILTGTRRDGSAGSETQTMAGTCSDWTSSTGLTNVGSSAAVGSDWTDHFGRDCGDAMPCIVFRPISRSPRSPSPPRDAWRS